MALITAYQTTGTDQVDEEVICDEASGGFFLGYTNYIVAPSIQGIAHATYGAWTAVGKGGIRHTVLIAGDPADGTEISIDLTNGIVTSFDSETYYLRYSAHGPVRRGEDYLKIEVDRMLPDGVADSEIWAGRFPRFFNPAYVDVFVHNNEPSASTTLTLTAGANTQNITIPITAAPNNPALVSFTNPFKVTTSQQLILSTLDGNDLAGFSIELRGL